MRGSLILASVVGCLFLCAQPFVLGSEVEKPVRDEPPERRMRRRKRGWFRRYKLKEMQEQREKLREALQEETDKVTKEKIRAEIKDTTH